MLICSCEGVTQKEILECIRDGANDVTEVGMACYAGTDCGGCMDSIIEILDENKALIRVRKIAEQITYRDWVLRTEVDNTNEGGRIFLQWVFVSDCVLTGETKEWLCRKWYLSPHMLEGEVVKTAFAAALAAEEHDCRERFKYKTVRLFNPHISLEAMMSVAHRETTRESPIDEDLILSSEEG